MKKICKQNGEISFSGESGINSICFKAYITKGPVSISKDAVIARIDEKGEITCSNKDSYENERKTFINVMEAMKSKYKKMFFNISIACFIMSIVLGFFSIIAMNIMMSVYFLFWACYLVPDLSGLFFEKLRKNEDSLSLLRFHSAEHAAINAYYDLGRVPTLEEIRGYSNFSYSCGSLSQIIKFVPFLLVAITRLLPSFWFVISTIIIFTMIFWFPESKLYFMEFLVTAEPTDREYKVAIAGIEQAVNEIKDIEISEVELMKDIFSKIIEKILDGKDEKFLEKCQKFSTADDKCKTPNNNKE